jgi:hypothetical protein
MRHRSFWALAKLSVGIALLVLLGGCAMPGDSIFDDSPPPIVPPVVDGYGNPAPELQREQYQSDPQVTPMPMMEDPEAQTEEWEEEVWARDQGDADRICRLMADKLSRRSGKLVTYQNPPQVLSAPKAATKSKPAVDGKFVCRFRSEV